MKRKLRIFSHIAIICLSVCMFAFGVYAASTVSVTTSGTVTFTAKNVTASVTRKLEGINEEKSTFLDDSGTDDENVYTLAVNKDTAPEGATALIDTLKEESLVFENYATPIVMTFTITNLSTDSNIDVTPPEALATSGNVITAVDVFEPAYSGTKVNVNPNGISGDSLIIKIYFYVKDPNASANLSYNFTIGLANQEKFENSATVTGATQTKVGNTYLFATSLATSNTHFEKYDLTGANCYDYMPYISGTNCIVPVHAYGTNAITYSATVTAFDSSYHYYMECMTMDADGFNYHNFEDFTGKDTLIIPIAANNEGIIKVVNELYAFDGSNYNSVKKVVFPLTLLGFYSCNFSTRYIPNLIIESYPRYAKVFNSGTFNETKLTCAVLPNTVEVIESGSILDVSLTELTIPRSVEVINVSAIGGRSLVRVNYLGTKAQWESKFDTESIFSCGVGAKLYFVDGTSIDI